MNDFLEKNDVPHPADPHKRLLSLASEPSRAKSKAKPIKLMLHVATCDEFGNYDPNVRL